MDPLTQGVLGAALPAASARPGRVLAAGLLGAVSGMAPDLDVLIRSPSDPLLFLEYHRQFSHSLAFIPLGALLCALLLHPLLGRRHDLSFRLSYLFCLLGYATHGLLDACTTYGTLLLWPFSDARVAWNTISIIDPLFTLPLLVLVVLAARRRRPALARLGLVWAAAYLLLGLWQRDSAEQLGLALARERGHVPLRLEAKPAIATVLLWKVVYETGERYYVDAVRTGPWPQVYPGDSLPRLEPARDLAWLDPASQQARDVERFRWFSNDYLAADPLRPNRVIDIRYSMLPNEILPLWSIELQPGAGSAAHAAYRVHRDGAQERLPRLWQMLVGGSAGQRGLGGGHGGAGGQ